MHKKTCGKSSQLGLTAYLLQSKEVATNYRSDQSQQTAINKEKDKDRVDDNKVQVDRETVTLEKEKWELSLIMESDVIIVE